MRIWFRRILHATLTTLAMAGMAPLTAQGPAISFSLPNNLTVYTADAQIVVTICSDLWVQSQAATHTSTSGTNAVALEDGATANCPGGGSAYYANLTLQPGWNTLFVEATDEWWNYSSASLSINYYVAAQSSYHVKVTAPGQGGVRLTPGTSRVLPFVFTNVGATSSDFTVTVSCTGGFSSCRKAGGTTSFATGTLASLASVTVDLQVLAGSAATSGIIRAIAVSSQSTDNPDTASTPLFKTNAVPAAPIVTRARDVVNVPSNSTGRSAAFRITNPDAYSAATLTLSATCSSPLTSCAISPSNVTLAAQRDTLVALTFNVPTSSATTKVKLTATPSAFPNDAKSDSSTVVIGSVPATVVAVDVTSTNAGGSVARDQCLSIAAGDAAGVECGTLRLAHGAPGIRTMDRERAPTLLYSSHTAKPMVWVAAQVSVSNLQSPASLTATLQLPASSVVRTWAWSPECATASGCRIVIPVNADTLGLTTGVYAYTLQVRVGPVGSPVGQQSGKLVVVNDRQSPFGAGWWLEGLERLLPIPGGPNFLWIGGDASTRIYVQRSATVYTVETEVSRPDTLLKVSNRWERHLRNGGSVVFDSLRRHVETRNRQGHVTSFAYDGTGRVSTITLPGPSAALASLRRFTLGWKPGGSVLLETITSPASAGGTRVTTLATDAAGRVVSITDPDSKVVTFGYSGTSKRIISRTNRVAAVTNYGYDAFGAVSSVSLAMSPAITSTFCPAETRSLVACAGDGTAATPQPRTRVVTRLDGPRSDVLDVTVFHIGRFGAPDTIVDALGGRTRLKRTHATFPALVTEVIDAADLVTQTAYNGRGLPTTTTIVNPLGDNVNAITSFAWHPRWDMTESVTAPTGEVDMFGLDTANGNRLWQQRGSNVSTRVHFGFDTKNRLTTITHNSVVLSQNLYGADATTQGNLWKTVGTRNDTVTVEVDDIGQPRSIWTPTGDADGPSTWTQQVLTRDIMGRVLRDSTRAAARSWTLNSEDGLTLSGTAPLRIAMVVNTYDNEGRPLSVSRYTPGATPSESWLLATSASSSWTYDAAGRVLTATTAGGKDTNQYNPAGHVVRTTTKRGLDITQQFDALGRVIARTTPAVRLTQFSCVECSPSPAFNFAPTRFPYFGTRMDDNAVSPDVVIETETSFYAYDVAGRLVQADNPFALVRRGYYPNGALKADTSIARVYDRLAADPFPNTFRSVLSYTYDRSGRRLTRTDGWGGRQTYAYDILGQLKSTTDWAMSTGDSVHVNFEYDSQGRLVTQAVPDAHVSTSWTYDASGQPITRIETTSGDATAGYYDQIQYDARGKRIRVTGRPLYAGGVDEEFVGAYDGFGHLVASGTGGGAVPTMDEMVVDGHGFVRSRHSNRRSGFPGTEALNESQYSGDRLTSTVGVLRPEGRGDPSGVGPLVKQIDSVTVAHDASGNVGWQTSVRLEWITSSIDNNNIQRSQSGSRWTASLYDAEERLRFSQVAQLNPGPPNALPIATQLEYWYDALGRRILIRARVDSTTCGASITLPCQQPVVRTVWDGDQIVREKRTIGGWQLLDNQVDGGGGSGPFYGTVRTMQTGAIDVPLAIWKDDASPRVLHRNWRGSVGGATFVATQAVDQVTAWPAALTDIQLAPDARREGANGPPLPTGWYGALVEDQKDPTGLLYRRNRYYDPQTGRFTQEDPIGLAGGLNLYGYANGDPINFSDPFGTCAVPGLRPGVLNFAGRCLFKYKGMTLAEADFWSRNKADALMAARARGIGSAYAEEIGALFGASGDDDIVNAARHIVGTCWMTAYYSEQRARNAAGGHEEHSSSDASDTNADKSNNERGYKAGREAAADGATRHQDEIAATCASRATQMIRSGDYAKRAP